MADSPRPRTSRPSRPATCAAGGRTKRRRDAWILMALLSRTPERPAERGPELARTSSLQIPFSAHGFRMIRETRQAGDDRMRNGCPGLCARQRATPSPSAVRPLAALGLLAGAGRRAGGAARPRRLRALALGVRAAVRVHVGLHLLFAALLLRVHVHHQRVHLAEAERPVAGALGVVAPEARVGLRPADDLAVRDLDLRAVALGRRREPRLHVRLARAVA